MRRTPAEDPDVGESSRRAQKQPAAPLGPIASVLSRPRQPPLTIPTTAGSFGIIDIATSLPEVGDTITAASGTSSLRRTASEDHNAGEGSGQSQIRPAAPSGVQLSASEVATANDDQIALLWSQGEVLGAAAFKRWALALGELPKYQEAWLKRNIFNDRIHADRGWITSWYDHESQDVAYWLAQGLSWKALGPKIPYHSGKAPGIHWHRKLSTDPKYGWVEGVRQWNKERLATEEKQEKSRTG